MTRVSLLILLALVDGPLHGYGILRVIKERTEDRIQPSLGTVYPCLRALTGAGLIKEIEEPPQWVPSDNRPRRFFSITPKGRILAREELSSWATLVRQGIAAGLLENTGPEPTDSRP